MGIALLVGKEHLGRKGVAPAALILAAAVVITAGGTSGTTWQGALLIAMACLGWSIDNNISQRLSIRDPIQIALLKSIGASVPDAQIYDDLMEHLNGGYIQLGLVALAFGGLQIWWISRIVGRRNRAKPMTEKDFRKSLEQIWAKDRQR